MMQYRNAISSMQGMLDILTGLRKIREHIPVREAVSGVVNERREFVRGCPALGPTSVCLMHEATYCHRYLVYASRCTPVNMLSVRASRCRNSSLLPGTRVPRSSRASNSPCTFHHVSLGCRTCMWLRRAKYSHTSSIRLKICNLMMILSIMGGTAWSKKRLNWGGHEGEVGCFSFGLSLRALAL